MKTMCVVNRREGRNLKNLSERMSDEDKDCSISA